LLSRAGVGTVSMGVEAANDEMRNNILKRHMSREQIVQAGHLLRDADIHVTATNILGLPGSRLEDDLDTMRLNAEARISFAHAFLFQPYPGTELGAYAQEHEFMVGNFDDISSIAWERSIMVFEDPGEKGQVEHLQRWFAIGAEFPWMEPVIRQLIKLPHNKVVDTAYWWIHKVFKGWMISRRIHPTKFSPKKLWDAAGHFFRMDS
jgi:anaerobic magnesium-protoporphyrin IX monomethyl ester cyclase